MPTRHARPQTQVLLSAGGFPPPCTGVAAVRYPPDWDSLTRRAQAGFQIVQLRSGSAELRTDRFFCSKAAG
jgi:hypothetical protein